MKKVDVVDEVALVGDIKANAAKKYGFARFLDKFCSAWGFLIFPIYLIYSAIVLPFANLKAVKRNNKLFAFQFLAIPFLLVFIAFAVIFPLCVNASINISILEPCYNEVKSELYYRESRKAEFAPYIDDAQRLHLFINENNIFSSEAIEENKSLIEEHIATYENSTIKIPYLYYTAPDFDIHGINLEEFYLPQLFFGITSDNEYSVDDIISIDKTIDYLNEFIYTENPEEKFVPNNYSGSIEDFDKIAKLIGHEPTLHGFSSDYENYIKKTPFAKKIADHGDSFYTRVMMVFIIFGVYTGIMAIINIASDQVVRGNNKILKKYVLSVKDKYKYLYKQTAVAFEKNLIKFSNKGKVEEFYELYSKSANEVKELQATMPYLTKSEKKQCFDMIYGACLVLESKANADNLKKQLKSLHKNKQYAEILTIKQNYMEKLKESKEYSMFNAGLFKLKCTKIAVRILKFFPISILTFGISSMYGDILWQRFWTNHTIIDGRPLVFEGKVRTMIWLKFKHRLLSLITLGIYSFFVKFNQKKIMTKKTHIVGYPREQKSKFDGNTFLFGWLKFVIFIPNLLTLGIFSPFFICLIEKYMCKHTVYDGKRLTFDGKGSQWFGNNLLYIFLCFITLGIFSFWRSIYKQKWITQHTHFEKEENDETEQKIEVASTEQSEAKNATEQN